MTRDRDLSLAGLFVVFLLASGYCLTLLLTASYWFDALLKQPSWVVVAGIVGALSVPVLLARTVRRREPSVRRAQGFSRIR